MKKLLFSFFVILPIVVNAYDFNVNGLYYNITSLSSATVEVTFGPDYYSGDIIIPNKVIYQEKEYSVTAIGENAFHDDLMSMDEKNITVKMNSIMTEIGPYAFKGSKIKTITIPNNVLSIKECAFDDCLYLEEMIFEDSDDPIDLGSGWINPNFEHFPFFYGFSRNGKFKKLYIGRVLNSLTRNNRYCSNIFGLGLKDYGDASVETIILGEKITRIEDYSFTEIPALKEVLILGKISYVGVAAFMGDTSIESFEIPDNCTVGKSAFADCSGLKNVSIGNVNIADNQFENCTGLTSIDLPHDTKSIGEYAFAGCSGLNSLIIPRNVKNIGHHAFEDCKNLNSIKSFIMMPYDIDESTFSSIIYLNVPLQVPQGKKTSYSNAGGWKNFATINDNLESDEGVYIRVSCNKGGKIILNGESVENNSMSFELSPKSEIEIQVIPEYGYRLKQMMVNGIDVSKEISSEGYYTMSDIKEDVVVIAEFEKESAYLEIKDAEGGSIRLKVNDGSRQTLTFTASEGWRINAIIYNGRDVTLEALSNNEFTTTEIYEGATISISYEFTNSSIDPNIISKAKVYELDGQIIVKDADNNESITVYDESGRIVAHIKARGTEERITINGRGVYLVKLNGKTIKVCI